MNNQSKNAQSHAQKTAHSATDAASSVLFQTYRTEDGHLIGEMSLNAPKSLNALSVEMCQLMSAQLLEWQHDDQVAAVLLRGAGEKAFCAGGDIRKLYDSMVEHQGSQAADSSTPQPANPYATEFFGSEYDLYRQMHYYCKPLILWGSGIVMGGGMGLMAGCSHRIVTETTRFAMPEITIGLFPDATGSWFLQRMPAKIGLFLGLTGAQCNANDALLVNLAEYVLPSGAYAQVVDALTQANWQGPAASDVQTNSSQVSTNNRHLVADHHARATVSRVLSELLSTLMNDNDTKSTLTLKPSQLMRHWLAIQRLMNCGGLADIDALMRDDNKLAQLDAKFAQDEWTQKALATYRHGCPVTAALTFELFHKVATLSLEQILYLETNVAVNCAKNPDFREGVRALLIDKDKNPQWSMSMADCLTAEGQGYIESHFASPYPPHEHPFCEWLSDKAYGIKVLH